MNYTWLRSSFLLLGIAVLTIGGAAAYGYFVGHFGGQISGLQLTESMILHTAIGAALFVTVSGGYFLLRAVRNSRLGGLGASGIFILLGISAIFLPELLMLVSRTFWPQVFHGDAGWNFLLAFFVTAALVAGLLVAFIIALLFCPLGRVEAHQTARER